MITSDKDKIKESCSPEEKITYEKLNSEYRINGRSQVLKRITNQICRKTVSSLRTEKCLIYKKLNRIVDNLMLNELELTLWAIYLEKFPFRKEEKISKEYLIFSAFKAKSELIDNIELYFSYLTQNNLEFKNKYMEWALENKNNLEYTPNDLNDKFRELTRIDEINGDL